MWLAPTARLVRVKPQVRVAAGTSSHPARPLFLLLVSACSFLPPPAPGITSHIRGSPCGDATQAPSFSAGIKGHGAPAVFLPLLSQVFLQ